MDRAYSVTLLSTLPIWTAGLNVKSNDEIDAEKLTCTCVRWRGMRMRQRVAQEDNR